MKHFSIMKLKNITFGLVIVQALASCTMKDSDSTGLGEYQTETITVEEPGIGTKLLDKSHYSIDSVCSLSMPRDLEHFSVRKFLVKNNRVYIWAASYSDAIFAFDSNGYRLYRIGGQGRPENELIDRLSDFFVDGEDNIHIFSQAKQRISVFDKNGKYLRTTKIWKNNPSTIGVTENGRYLYSFAENTCGAALSICSYENNIQHELIPFGKEHDEKFPITQNFFQNGRKLCHIPLMSDSVLVFDNDKLEKVVRVNFKGKFIKDMPPKAVISPLEQNKPTEYEDALCINKYQETDSFALLGYICGRMGVTRFLLKNKNTKEISGGRSLFEGFLSYTNAYLLDNKLVILVTDVDYLKEARRTDEFMEKYNKSDSKIQEIIDGKIRVPAIMYITLR